MLSLYFSLLGNFSNKKALEILNEKNELNMFWWKGDNNFGDEINPLLLSKITKKNIVQIYNPKLANLFAIGSVLNFANQNSVVWGSGFLKKNKIFCMPPAKIMSVRGKLTRKIVNDLGFKVNAVGDLGLIVPDFFTPTSKETKYKVGLIPHYVDKNNDFVKTVSKYNKDVKVIDIQGDIQTVIDEMNSCEVIFSTSLHGIIIADAYGIEAHWIRLSDNVVGGNFKFHDYFSSVGRDLTDPYIVDPRSSIKDILDSRINYNVKIDKNQIYESSPFI